MTKADLWLDLWKTNPEKASKTQPKLQIDGRTVFAMYFNIWEEYKPMLIGESDIKSHFEWLMVADFIREYFTDLGETK